MRFSEFTLRALPRTALSGFNALINISRIDITVDIVIVTSIPLDTLTSRPLSSAMKLRRTARRTCENESSPGIEIASNKVVLDIHPSDDSSRTLLFYTSILKRVLEFR